MVVNEVLTKVVIYLHRMPSEIHNSLSSSMRVGPSCCLGWLAKAPGGQLFLLGVLFYHHLLGAVLNTRVIIFTVTVDRCPLFLRL